MLGGVATAWGVGTPIDLREAVSSGVHVGARGELSPSPFPLSSAFFLVHTSGCNKNLANKNIGFQLEMNFKKPQVMFLGYTYPMQ